MNSPKTERLPSRHPVPSMQLSKRKAGRILGDADVASGTRLNGDSNKSDITNGNRQQCVQEKHDKPKHPSVLVVPSDTSLQYINGMEADNRIHDTNDSKETKKPRHSDGMRQQESNGPARRSWRPAGGTAAFDSFSNRSVGSSERSATGYHAESRKFIRRRNGRPPRGHDNFRNRHEAEGWRRRRPLDNCLKTDQRNSPQLNAIRTGSSLSKMSGSSDKTSASSAVDAGQPKKDSKPNLPSRPVPSKLASESTSGPAPSAGKAEKAPPKLKSQVKRLSQERTITPKKESTSKTTPGVKAAAPLLVLPASSGNWTIQKSSTGKQYYYNKKTKVSQWTLPAELSMTDMYDDDGRQLSILLQMVFFSSNPPSGSVTQSKDVKESEGKKPAPKRKADEVVSPGTSVATPKYPKVTPRKASLLGSPISDEDDNGMSQLKACAISSAQSVEMDISDECDSMISNPSKTAVASIPRRALPSKVSKEIPRKPCAEIPSTSKRAKPPTVDDLRKLNESLDPEDRRSDKLQRVEKWMRKLETPVENVPSPPDDVSLSPVSSVASIDSVGTSPSRPADSPVVTSTALFHLESDSSHTVPCPSPLLPPGGCSKITLPTFDLCELPDLSKSELPAECSVTLTQIFRSLKIEATEDQRCKILLDSLPQQHCRADEKTVVMKNNMADIRQTKIVMASETEHITFLSKFEDELFRSIHAGPEIKAPDISLKHTVKLESVELDIKEENSNDSSAKRVLAAADVFPAKGLEISV